MMGDTIHMACCSSHNNIHHPMDGILVLQFVLNLVPHIGCSVAWMDSIPMYLLGPRLVRPFPCTHKTYGMGDNTFMVCGPSPNNIHHPGDGMVVLHFLIDLVL